MANYSKQLLSASIDGGPVLVAATFSPGDLVHQCAVTAVIDEIVLYAASQASTDVLLTLEIGGEGASYQSPVTISPKSGQVLVLAGIPLRNGLAVKAFADQSGVISLWGFVNRIA